MINQIMNLFLKIFLKIFEVFANILLLPLTNLCNMFFPNLNSIHIQRLNYWLEHYIFDGINFAKMVFINVTHFNTDLIGYTIAIFTALLTFSIALKSIGAVLNLWRFLRKGE